MSAIASVKPPKLETLAISIEEPGRVAFKGTITTENPSSDVGAFMRALHNAALADNLKAMELDVSGLTFVNSSAIRLFIDWASWIRATGRSPYVLRIRSSRNITWQKTSFMALTSLAPGIVEIQQVD
jgi:hypothetical protein